MPRYFLRTLGSLSLVESRAPADVGGEAPLLGPGKPTALLAYLALAPQRSAHREECVDLLWSNLEPDRARLSLRQALWQLRSALGPESIDSEGQRLVLRADVAVDLLDFQAAARGERAEAIALFSGRFMDAVSFPGGAAFEHWADLERARADALLLYAAEAIAQEALRSGRPADAMDAARRTRALLGRHQGAWRLFLETCLAVGDRPLALIESEVLEQSLRDDEDAPEPALAATLNRVRRATESSVRMRREFESEFVGREEEFATLLKAYHASLGGRPLHVHLSGAAGLGKSRLLHELGDRFRVLRARVAAVSAVPSDRSLPFALLARVAETIGALPGAASVGRGSAAVLVRLAPALSSAFQATDVAAEPDDALARTQALRELIEAIAGERHLVLMVDDLHWGDQESMDALHRVADRLPSNVLLVTASRPPVALHATTTVETRTLPPLSDAQVYALLVGVGYSATPAEDGALAGAMAQASGGSPLLVLQLVRQGLDEGWLLRDGERLAPAPGIDLRHMLERADPIGRRLRELPAVEGEMLQLLATAEVGVDEDALAEASGAEARSVLQSLASRGLVTADASGWRCAHDLIRERVIASHAPAALRDGAARLGRVLGRHAPSITRARVGARLLVEGGDTASLRDLVAYHVRQSRASGQDRPARAVARELVGVQLPDPQLRALLRSLPLPLRATRRLWIAASVALAAIMLSSGTFLAVDRSPRLVVAQQPLAAIAGLADRQLHEVRPPLIVEQRDRQGRLVDRPGEIVDVFVRDSATGEDDSTTAPLTGGRAVFESIRSRQEVLRSAVVRRRGAADSVVMVIERPSAVSLQLRLVSFRTAAGVVSPERPTLRVPPGAQVDGVLRIRYTTMAVDETIVYAWTPTWGDAARVGRRFGMLSTPFTDRPRDDVLRFTAPTAPGEYFVIVTAGTETDATFLLSGTNWELGEPVWGDGNDVAQLSREALLRGLRGEDVPTAILRRREGNVVLWPDHISAVVIRVVVDPQIEAMRVE